MATFEPEVVRNWCANHYNGQERIKHLERWDAKVCQYLLNIQSFATHPRRRQIKKRVNSWKDSRESQSLHLPQLEFVAHICEYVSFLAKLARPPPKSGVASVPLNLDVPFLGPHFIPPSFVHTQRRQATPEITPDPTYLKPVNIVHPIYYPGILERCPNCRIAGVKSDISWNGWNPTGPREVHGLMQEETAIGVQLRCKSCKRKYSAGNEEVKEKKDLKGKKDANAGKKKKKKGRKMQPEVELADEESDASQESEGKYCFATTNHLFWKKVEHWEIPG